MLLLDAGVEAGHADAFAGQPLRVRHVGVDERQLRSAGAVARKVEADLDDGGIRGEPRHAGRGRHTGDRRDAAPAGRDAKTVGADLTRRRRRPEVDDHLRGTASLE